MIKRYRFIVLPWFENGRALGWDYSKFTGASVYDEAGNVIKTDERMGEFRE
jgi:hypothetical protein